jgi:hypothetical protein
LRISNYWAALAVVFAVSCGGSSDSGSKGGDGDGDSNGSSSGDGGGGASSSDGGGSSSGGGDGGAASGGCPTSQNCTTCLQAHCQSQLDGESEEGEAQNNFRDVAACICAGGAASDCEHMATAQLYFPVQQCAKTNCPTCGF